MNVEIGAEAALFPEKEDINGIAVAVHFPMFNVLQLLVIERCDLDKLEEVFLLAL
jgi:hypothetical protein